jgi:putative flippase GtrA
MALKQFALFLMSGGVAAGLNWGSRFVFSEYFRLEVAVILAFFVGLITGFVMMRMFVFSGAGKPILPQAGKYIAINLFALVQTLFITLVFARWLLPSLGFVVHADAIAHLIGVLVPVATSYFGHKFLTFR